MSAKTGAKQNRFAICAPEGVSLVAHALRASHGITVPCWPPMHPGWLRCSSLTDSRYARSSRLARWGLDTQYDTPIP